MTTINMADYWPDMAIGEQLLVQDCSSLGLSVLHRYRCGGVVDGAAVIQLDDYTTEDGWVDAWEYRFDPTLGVVEVGNKFPPGKHQVYKTNKWIPWGGVQNIGDSFGKSIEVDLATSTGISAGPGNYGWQQVAFEELIPSFTNYAGLGFANVLKILVLQTWCATAACPYPSGQYVYKMRYWLAPGVGIIQTDYIEPGIGHASAQSVTKTVAMPL